MRRRASVFVLCVLFFFPPKASRADVPATPTGADLAKTLSALSASNDEISLLNKLRVKAAGGDRSAAYLLYAVEHHQSEGAKVIALVGPLDPTGDLVALYQRLVSSTPDAAKVSARAMADAGDDSNALLPPRPSPPVGDGGGGNTTVLNLYGGTLKTPKGGTPTTEVEVVRNVVTGANSSFNLDVTGDIGNGLNKTMPASNGTYSLTATAQNNFVDRSRFVVSTAFQYAADNFPTVGIVFEQTEAAVLALTSHDPTVKGGAVSVSLGWHQEVDNGSVGKNLILTYLASEMLPLSPTTSLGFALDYNLDLSSRHDTQWSREFSLKQNIGDLSVTLARALYNRGVQIENFPVHTNTTTLEMTAPIGH